jgi:hypothetical protein
MPTTHTTSIRILTSTAIPTRHIGPTSTWSHMRPRSHTSMSTGRRVGAGRPGAGYGTS